MGSTFSATRGKEYDFNRKICEGVSSQPQDLRRVRFQPHDCEECVFDHKICEGYDFNYRICGEYHFNHRVSEEYVFSHRTVRSTSSTTGVRPQPQDL